MRTVRTLIGRALAAGRPIVAVGAIVAVLAGALAIGFGLAELRKGAPMTGVLGPSPRPIGVVPWVPGRAVPWVVPTPVPRTSMPMRFCQSSELDLDVHLGAAMGTRYTTIALANRSATPCQLFGVPTVLPYSAAGRDVATRVSADPAAQHPVPVVLEPGRRAKASDPGPGVAMLRLAWSPWCGPDIELLALVVVQPSGDSFTVPPPGTVAGEPLRMPARCDLSLSLPAVPFLSVGPFEPSFQPPPPTPSPAPLILTATIDAPATALIGATLRYTVTLANATASMYAFGECPVFQQWIAKNGGRYRLACESVGPLAPGASATFEMLVDLDQQRSSPDPWDIRWHLEPYPNSAEATARVVLRHPGPAATPAPKPTP